MKALGRQLLVEFYGCDSTVLNDKGLVRQALSQAAVKAGATVVTDVFHEFNPHGISGVVVIAESHLAIHTWPEFGFAAVDLFTCGDDIDPDPAMKHLQKEFKADRVSIMELKRGVLDREDLRHKPISAEKVLA
ncbi:S-adenosylmethionine decarboxylase proenzyme [bacterium SM23_57]|nr:MAG: S-adenosylmethionine decarboxylase proenzyme [bacterium SM23_57]